MKEKCYEHIMYLNNKVLCLLSSDKLNSNGDTFIYKGVKYQITLQMDSALIEFNSFKEHRIVPCIVKKLGQIKYKWVAECSDGSFNDESRESYETKEECYCYMRDAALEKMKWNTEYQQDFDNEEDSIGYEVSFSQNEIKHISYSGTYTYKIIEVTI